MAGIDGEQIRTGRQGKYQWLTSSGETYMGTLIRLCPEAVLGRFIAVASIDSGVPVLTERQKSAGWKFRDGAVYSRSVQSVDELFYQQDGPDSPGYDEWYIFEEPADLGPVSMDHPFLGPGTPVPNTTIVFVNYPFTIHGAEPLYDILRELFWAQMEKIQPESYIADGRDCLTFVSRDSQLFEQVRRRLSPG